MLFQYVWFLQLKMMCQTPEKARISPRRPKIHKFFIDFFSADTYNISVRTFYGVRLGNTVYANTFRNVRQRNIAYTNTLHNVRQRNIVYQPPVRAGGFLLQERGIQ